MQVIWLFNGLLSEDVIEGVCLFGNRVGLVEVKEMVRNDEDDETRSFRLLLHVMENGAALMLICVYI